MKAILAHIQLMLIVKSYSRKTSTYTVRQIAQRIQNDGNKILVMAGAGLSTPSGIPDFRSPESGLYSKLETYNLPYPEAIFDLNYYANNPGPFLHLAKTIYPGAGDIKPNIGHYFVRLLNEKGKLLRMYTQNIDGLERLSGINEDHLVEAHGGFSTASCIRCGLRKNPDVVKAEILEGKEPRCGKCKGLVKPDITFFGEMLPERFSHLSENDSVSTDFLIVIGTSLVVHPFAGLANLVNDDVPRLLINREEVGSFGLRRNDILLLGDIVEQIKDLIAELGWTKDLNNLIHSNGVKS